MRPVVFVLAACLLAAGCSAVTPPAPTHPAASPTRAGVAAAASPSATATSAPAPRPLSANAVACRKIEGYPQPKTPGQVAAYGRFLVREAGRPGTSSRFDNHAERLAADLAAYLAGVASEAAVAADAHQLVVICAGYGVRS